VLSALAALAPAPLAPFLLDALGLSRAQAGLFLPALYLGGVLMAVPAGWLTDRLGVRRTLALGQALTGAAVTLAAAGASLPGILACLTVAGFGFSVANPATGRAVMEWFPPRQRGLAMGIKQTGLTLGGVLGALTLPPIALAFGWRAAFVTAGALTALSGLLVTLLYRRPPVSLVDTAAARPPLSDVGAVLRRPGVAVVFVCGFLFSLAQASILAYLALYARETYAVSAVTAGRLLALAQVGGTLARLGGGWASDRFLGGRRRPGIVVTGITAALAFIALAFGERVPVALAAVLAVLVGAGAFGWVGLYFALVAEMGGARWAGVLTGIAVVFAWSGVLVGPVLFGALAEAGGYAGAWLLLAAIVLSAAAAIARLKPLVRREAATPASGA
jgi:sugar phosphate permease